MHDFTLSNQVLEPLIQHRVAPRDQNQGIVMPLALVKVILKLLREPQLSHILDLG